MSAAGVAARRVTLLKNLYDQIGAALVEAREAADRELEVGDRKTATLDDGTAIGSVTKAKPSESARVADEVLLRSWVAQNHPKEIRTTEEINPTFRTALMKSLTNVGGVAVDERTGEVVPGIEYRVGKPSLRVTVDDDHAAAQAAALADGRLTLADVVGLAELEASDV